MKHTYVLMGAGLVGVALLLGGGLTYVYLGANRPHTEAVDTATPTNETATPQIIEKTIIKEVPTKTTAPAPQPITTPVQTPIPVTTMPSSPTQQPVVIQEAINNAQSMLDGAKMAYDRTQGDITNISNAIPVVTAQGRYNIAIELNTAANIFMTLKTRAQASRNQAATLLHTAQAGFSSAAEVTAFATSLANGMNTLTNLLQTILNTEQTVYPYLVSLN